MPCLVVRAGPDAGRRFELPPGGAVVGRHSACTVALSDERVSRRHFELRPVPGGGHDLADLGSGNGTRLNGGAVAGARLRSGDRLEVGGTVLEYLADGATSPAPPPFAGSIVRSVPADAGSQLLRDPSRAGTDWLRGRLGHLTAVYEAGELTGRIQDAGELVERIAALAARAVGADRGCALLRDPATGKLARPGAGGAAVSLTVAEHVIDTGEGVIVADAAADARFGGTESVARHRLREVICVPLKGRHDTVGALFLDAAGDSGPRFHADHLLLAAALGHQAAVAVEETRHYHALLAAERLAAVGQAMAALSHHVKNIMQGVRFGGDLVRMGLAGDDRPLLEKGWKLVERNQRRIDELILDMLGYSKEREPGAESVELGALARDALELVAGRAAELGVELRFDAPPRPVTVSGDPEGFHRALLNVVSNALDAVESAEVKLVEVALTATAGGGAELAVRDTGPGIEPEMAEDIFKPFVSTKGSRGTGLGLPVSRKTMREHDGDLTATRWSGGGSEFVLRFAAGGR